MRMIPRITELGVESDGVMVWLIEFIGFHFPDEHMKAQKGEGLPQNQTTVPRSASASPQGGIPQFLSYFPTISPHSIAFPTSLDLWQEPSLPRQQHQRRPGPEHSAHSWFFVPDTFLGRRGGGKGSSPPTPPADTVWVRQRHFSLLFTSASVVQPAWVLGSEQDTHKVCGTGGQKGSEGSRPWDHNTRYRRVPN